MKSFKILFAVLILVLVIGLLFTCGSKDIDKAAKYITKMNEYIASEDFSTAVKGLVDEAIVTGEDSVKNFDNAKFSADFTKILDTKADEVAKEVGLKDSKNANLILDKNKKEDKIKDLLVKYEETIKKMRTDLEKEGTTKAAGTEETEEETTTDETGTNSNTPDNNTGETVPENSQQ